MFTRRKLITLLSIFMVMLLVTACGGDEEEPAAPAEGQPVEQAVTEEATEAVAEATEEPTEAATEEATEEATEAATEEAMAEATEAATEEATEEAMAEATEEATEEAGAEIPDDGRAEADIKIGVMAPLTGGAAFLGQEQLNFARVATEVFNEETGFNIQLVEGDTMLNPDESKIVAERLIADDTIYAVVGPAGSQECEAVQPDFEEAGLAHITPSCTRTTLTDPGTATFFRIVPTDGDQGPTDASFMVEELGVQSAYLVDDQSSYAVGLTDEVEAALNELGVTQVERASVTQQDTDFSSLVTTIITSNPDVVFFPGQLAGQLGTMAAQLKEQGYEGIYFLADGGFDISWVESAGDAANGTYLSFFAPDPHFVPEAETITTHYQEEFGDFGAFGGPAALAARVASEAIQRCYEADTLTRECVVEEIGATDMETSLLGIPVSFGEGNQLEGGKFFIFQVQDGEFVLVQ
jgi:branched-chain amino acid transport system substrate-binding protein